MSPLPLRGFLPAGVLLLLVSLLYLVIAAPFILGPCRAHQGHFRLSDSPHVGGLMLITFRKYISRILITVDLDFASNARILTC